MGTFAAVKRLFSEIEIRDEGEAEKTREQRAAYTKASRDAVPVEVDGIRRG